MGLLEKAKNLSQWLASEDITKVAEEDLSSLVAAAMTNDAASGAFAIKKTITDVAHLPTYIFWCKMERFLRGIFRDFKEQVKMASRFDSTTDGYARFVSKLITILDQIEDTEKVDFFANLTRAFLLECIKTEELFYKLSKFLLICTYDELCFIRNCPYTYIETNTVMISALLQFGLFEQCHTVDEQTRYKLSGFAIALKQNSLNFNSELYEMKRISEYDDMKPLEILEPMSSKDILDILGASDDEIVLDGGTAKDILNNQ